MMKADQDTIAQMQYYVLGPDSSKYGPADIATINDWIKQNRVTPQMFLEAVETGEQILATNIPGLIFAAPLLGSAPQAFSTDGSNYPRPDAPIHYQPVSTKGVLEIVFSWVLFATSIPCSFVIPNIIGFFLASRARRLGHPSGKAAMIANGVMIILGLAYLVYMWPQISDRLSER